MMDYFSAMNDSAQGTALTGKDDVDAFANAIASRYKPSNINLPSPMTALAVTPNDLDTFLNDAGTLILDIRPHAAHSSARLPRALSLSVPSTLLKRPLFTLTRLSEMLPSLSARTRFDSWPSASRIIVYDTDATSIADPSNISGLLRKFKNAGFNRDLVWIQGGFQAIWRDRRDLLDTHSPTPDPDLDDDEDRPSLSTSSFSPSIPILRPRHLPMSAFSLSSTTVHKHRTNPSMSIPLPTSRPAFNPFFDAIRQNVELSHGITERIPLHLPRRVHRRIPDLPFKWLQGIAKKAQRAPRPHHHPLSLNHRPPFSVVPSSSSSEDTSDSDTNADQADIDEGTEALAMQFYRIELAEQRRLMSVMERHSRESGFLNHGANQPSFTFPYSITAGVEKGSKNRYRHIWPFEHARVRLHCRSEKTDAQSVMRDADDADNDDYVNASYVQPLGTSKRYIATQGPLEATFNDFWRLCWEQNVHVIVMLTKEVEGLAVKCGAYWVEEEGRERSFGPLTLKLVSKVSLPEHGPQTQGSGFFGAAIPHRSEPSHPLSTDPLSAHRHRRKPITTIKRTFELSHGRYPHVGARKVVQLQYLEWPDMNVPDDARGILGLVKEVEKAVDETWDGRGESSDNTALESATRNLDEQTGISKHALGGKERRPVLLHCSAGVGRTGGFIAVDAVLDAVRREMRKGQGQQREAQDPMDIDEDVSQGVDGMMTVPIPVSAGGEGQNANVGARVGLIMHVPVVVVPKTTGGDIPRIPMPADGEKGPHVGSASTREWAQDVSDQTGRTSFAATAVHSSVSPIVPLVSHHNHNHHFRPPFKKVSSSSSSSLPTDSDDSGSLGLQRIPKQSSSLGTSVSGSSEEEKLVGLVKRTESPLSIGSGAVSEEGQENMREADHGRVESLGRPRTLSAPHTHLKNISHLSGVGPSPLAKLSMPRLAGRRKSKHKARLAQAGLIGPSSDEGPFPLQTMASAGDENEAASSSSQIYTRSTLDPHRSLSKFSPFLPHPSLSLEQAPDRLAEEPRGSTVDYKEPRRLHDLNSPALLSSFEEPIWEVVQDMREQRMSLCQSLRQYVFVHAAIIEGALLIVDEERKREQETEVVVGVSATKSHSVVGRASSSFLNEDCPTPSVTVAPPLVPSVVRPSLTMSTNASEISMASTSSTGKRGASPTELLKEGKKGEVLLSKRPSIKRKQTRPSERALNSDQRTGAFHKQSQGQNYYQTGQGADSVSASVTGSHL